MRSNVVCPKCKTDNDPYNTDCTRCETPLIGDELRVMDKAVEVWSEFIKLPEGHPCRRLLSDETRG